MIGKTLGHYRIVEKIGEGGMGIVYRARDEHLGRDMAIKVLPPGALADEAARRRFRKEAEALSKLNQPHIATVYDFDSQNGVDFLVMEYIAGTSLAEKLTIGAMAEKELAMLGTQIATALEEAHEHGVVHCDLKPGNILVTQKGQAKVLDFGLAKLLRPASVAELTASITQTHAVAGTLPYMAPEQLRGENLDARTDIYALGVVLYEMATGQRPFRDPLPTRLTDAILHQAPQPPRALNQRISAALESIISKCLDKDPENRYQSAKEVGVDLRRLGMAASVAMAQPARPVRTGPRTVAAAVLAGVVLLGLLVGLNVGGLRKRLLGSGAAPRIESLAVLPLANLSGDPGQEYFADGMTEALITDLAKIRALKVISRTSVMRYKEVKKPLREIARELNVDAVVEGSVLRVGDRVRITAQLISAVTDEHLWAENYERDLRDVLALQSEVARAIAAEIRVKLTSQEQARFAATRPVDPEAYEAFLKGRYHWYRRSPDALKKALEYLERAIAKDPTYALAHAGLADAYNSLGWDLFAVLPPAEAYPKAKEAAKRALELDPNCAEAHAALGWAAAAYDWDWATAEGEFRRAIELKPQYGPVHIWYSHFLEAMGRTEESFEESKRAIESDPLGLILNLHMGWYYLFARQNDRAIEQLRKTLDLDPGFILARMLLGEAYEQTGMFEHAIAEFEKAVNLSERHPIYLAGLGHGYAVSGRRDDAQKTIKELQQLSSQRYVPARGIAEIYIGLGDKDQAFAWLDKALKQRNGWLFHIKGNPRYDSLRSDPRFRALLKRLNLPG